MKKSKVGWLKDETLKEFDFNYQGAVSDKRIALGLPLIAPNKKFWDRSNQKAVKVKVTVELIKKDEKVTEVRIGRHWGKGKAVFRGTDPIMIRKYKT